MATNRCFWSEKGSKVNQRAVSKEKSLINTRALRPKTRHVHPLQNVKYFFRIPDPNHCILQALIPRAVTWRIPHIVQCLKIIQVKLFYRLSTLKPGLWGGVIYPNPWYNWPHAAWRESIDESKGCGDMTIGLQIWHERPLHYLCNYRK